MDMKFEKNAIHTAVRLFQECFSEKENVLISPLSILIALAMTESGAEGNTAEAFLRFFGGEMTEEELQTLLPAYISELPSDEKCTFKFADSIWLRDSLTVKQEFVEKNTAAYRAEIRSAAFNDDTKEMINAWVKEKTDGMIDGIIDSVAPEALMYLINALVFDAEWQNIYNDREISDVYFTNADGSRVRVSGMFSDEQRYFEDNDCCGFLKNYAGGRFSFMAVLPKEAAHFNEFVRAFDERKLLTLMMTAGKESCKAMIPKFKTEYASLLNDVLGRMGLSEAFSAEADFSRMADEHIAIGEVIHKTYMEVDERGTKAGAVTAVMMKAMAMPVPKPEVLLNRPFLYAIIDNQKGIPMFIGTMMKLQEEMKTDDDEGVLLTRENAKTPQNDRQDQPESAVKTEKDRWWKKILFWKK